MEVAVPPLAAAAHLLVVLEDQLPVRLVDLAPAVVPDSLEDRAVQDRLEADPVKGCPQEEE